MKIAFLMYVHLKVVLTETRRQTINHLKIPVKITPLYIASVKCLQRDRWRSVSVLYMLKVKITNAIVVFSYIFLLLL